MNNEKFTLEYYQNLDNERLERQRIYNLKKNYGITAEQYDTLLKEQNGVCGICGETDNRRLCVDYMKDKGVVRGLLCTSCNLFVKKNDGLLATKAKDYIVKWAIKYSVQATKDKTI